MIMQKIMEYNLEQYQQFVQDAEIKVYDSDSNDSDYSSQKSEVD